MLVKAFFFSPSQKQCLSKSHWPSILINHTSSC